ncbi:MAG: uncharacterized protein QOC82_3253 [Frankiaceae bacterium]|jgi:uncharacterized protein (TIGR01777 family)|nr:uncharacterized protein [Frankiaceae bacterium]
MRWVVSGASGFIGTALVRALRAEGEDVATLVRRAPAAAGEYRWDPGRREIDPAALDGADVVVHLSGAGIGDRRWTDERKRLILASRVDSTTTLADAIAGRDDRPAVWLSGSAVGYYGDTGEETVDESSPSGAGYAAEVVRQWEASTAAASGAGVRVVHLRSGIVLSPEGATLGKLVPLFKFGLGGRLGSGRQWMSWIALADEVAAIRFLAGRDDIAGPVNLTAPEPVRNIEFTKSLARAVHRPAVFPVPSPALRAVFGGFADEGPLASQRVVPARLEAAGFDFSFDDIDAALTAMLS